MYWLTCSGHHKKELKFSELPNIQNYPPPPPPPDLPCAFAILLLGHFWFLSKGGEGLACLGLCWLPREKRRKTTKQCQGPPYALEHKANSSPSPSSCSHPWQQSPCPVSGWGLRRDTRSVDMSVRENQLKWWTWHMYGLPTSFSTCVLTLSPWD